MSFETAQRLFAEGKVHRERHLGQMLGGVAAVLGVAAFSWWAAVNPAFEWDVFAEYFTREQVLRGLWTTIWLTAAVIVISVLLGLPLAACRLSRIPVVVSLAWAYVWAFRSVPLLVQLIIWFNIGYFIPKFMLTLWPGQSLLVDTNQLVTATGAAVLGLSLHGIAIAGEIIRGGILGVAAGQTEAAQVLGLSDRYAFARIIVPQAMPSIVPALANMLIETLKGTSIVSVLAVHDLLYSVQAVYASNYKVVPLLMVATAWYVIVTSVLSIGQYFLEHSLARSSRSTRRERDGAASTGEKIVRAEVLAVHVGN